MIEKLAPSGLIPSLSAVEARKQIEEFAKELIARLVNGESKALIVEIGTNNTTFSAIPLNMAPAEVAFVCNVLLETINMAREYEQLKMNNPHVVN